MEEPKFTSIQPNLTGNIAKHSKIAKRIVECVAGRSSHKKQLTLGRRHVDKYLYTFAMEIGSDLPNDEILKTIFFLLIGSEENSSLNQKIEEEKFYILISVCLNIYQQAKKTAIGGIFQRIVIGLKQALYYIKLQSLYKPT